MDEKERELRQKLAAKLEEARKLTDEGKLEEARAIANEAKELRQQIDTLVELRGLIPNNPTVPIEPASRKNEPEVEYRDAFIKMLRGKALSLEERALLEEKRAMNSTTGEDGGYLIPPDIQTMINQIKRQYVSLEDYVTVVPVSTNSGSRVLEKYVDITPFAQITTENTDLAEIDNPKVKQVSFTIKDYGGILTLTNNLLADSPENIMAFVAQWIARKEIITDNSLILNILKTFPNKDLTNIDDIKKVLNVDLDPMISQGAVIVTNQDGFNFLDEKKDSMGRYLMQPDPTNPTTKLLFGKPVVVMANRLLPTDTQNNKAPIIIGDLKESVVVFDRQEISILSTNIGGTAFTTNTTKVRVIDREDVVKWDDGAAVYGQITLE
jgi:HK97 family phage major capsid protein